MAKTGLVKQDGIDWIYVGQRHYHRDGCAYHRHEQPHAMGHQVPIRPKSRGMEKFFECTFAPEPEHRPHSASLFVAEFESALAQPQSLGVRWDTAPKGFLLSVPGELGRSC